MPDILELEKAVDDIVVSYGSRIENIDSFFETTHFILSELQGPLLDTGQERDRINFQLQDLLARNEHLRRTDFNRMMRRILAIQVEKEKAIRNLAGSFLAEQKQTVNLLRDNLAKIKEALACGQKIEGKESKDSINRLLVQQDDRKRDVSLKLKEFQEEQKAMTRALLALLAKGKELRIKDLKAMLKEFDGLHKERLARRRDRKEEALKRKGAVRGMLVEFKKKRKESIMALKVDPVKAITPGECEQRDNSSAGSI